jgi:hypothetical protein
MIAVQKQAMLELQQEQQKEAEQQQTQAIQDEEFNKELGRQEVKQELAQASGAA